MSTKKKEENLAEFIGYSGNMDVETMGSINYIVSKKLEVTTINNKVYIEVKRTQSTDKTEMIGVILTKEALTILFETLKNKESFIIAMKTQKEGA